MQHSSLKYIDKKNLLLAVANPDMKNAAGTFSDPELIEMRHELQDFTITHKTGSGGEATYWVRGEFADREIDVDAEMLLRIINPRKLRTYKRTGMPAGKVVYNAPLSTWARSWVMKLEGFKGHIPSPVAPPEEQIVPVPARIAAPPPKEPPQPAPVAQAARPPRVVLTPFGVLPELPRMQPSAEEEDCVCSPRSPSPDLLSWIEHDPPPPRRPRADPVNLRCMSSFATRHLEEEEEEAALQEAVAYAITLREEAERRKRLAALASTHEDISDDEETAVVVGNVPRFEYVASCLPPKKRFRTMCVPVQ